ncbi:hypothetical protein N7540_010392 [Penicillium herquei]|nr:hypothetical protein N7540_010392 [Penicillium herquei]
MDHYYTKKAGFDQSRHDLSRSMRSINRHEMGDRSNTCASPSTELDAKLRNTQRRRVPVACHRCRKRKIKCSGDAGDGQGCSNCRSSGSKDCQFFRVRAHNLDDKEITAHHKAKGWDPYLNMGVAAPTQLGIPIGHTQQKAALASMRSPQSPTHHAAFQRTPDFDLHPADAHVFQRSGIANAIPYEDEPSVNYSQSSQYMLPNAPGVVMDYGSPVWTKGWDSMFNTGRTSNGGIYPELQSNASMNESQFAYMLPSQGHPLSELPPSTHAAMSAVSSPDMSGSDRTLPTPRSRNQQGPAPTLGFLPTEGNSNMSWSPPDFKGDFKGVFWSPRVATSIGSPPQTIQSNVPFTSSPELLNKGVNAPDLLFTYHTTSEDSNAALLCSSSVSSAALPSTTSGVTSTYPILGTLDTTSEYSSIPSNIKPVRKSSRNHTSAGQRHHALTNECTSNIHGYSSSAKRKARGGSDPDTRTLVSGLPYTRVQHRDSPGTNFSFNLLPGALPEYHRAVVENVHRPPVEPLGNQGAY